ncbi:T9SS type A sorting domain-containing protein [Polaribacter aestuariivivens]|uniref:T9SS type A sorting domain-containing protein n=1 Tax=Polaribacter aestuariivivens TaxID=2304626 RepID=A0A5S3NAB6_9FLAO|nr:T9SS type A sorting domain-containing protein [Polaribacter aestuariivivens]TMM30539.1 T9SS type A sorting domain-containing protein [Polaribacter aestuariivivens]
MKNSFLVLFLSMSSLLLAQTPDWSAKASDYQYSMNIIAFLNVNGNLLTNANDKVGAFSGNQARGEANVVYNASANKYVAYLTVLSNNPGETISFKVFDSTENKIIDIVKTEIFEIDKVIGGVFQSYSIASPQLKNTTTLESFIFKEVTASSININENTIDIVLPQGSQTTSLTPIFQTKDNAKVFYNNVKLSSDTQQIDFTNSVEIKILSEDESELKLITITTSVSQISNPNIVSLSTDLSTLNSNNFIITAGFSNEVNDLKNVDFSIVNGTVKEITKVNNKEYQVDIIAFANGEVQIEIPSNTVIDVNNEGNLASNKLVVNYDKNMPYLKEIRSDNNGFTVVFSEAVNNVSLENFELNGIAKDGFELTSLAQVNATTYQINTTNLNTKKGNINLNIKANNTIVDDANNGLLVQNFNTFYIDNEAPVVAVQNFELDLNGQASASITIDDIEVSASDNIGIKTKELSQTTFTNAEIGENTINYSVTDLVDNVTTKQVTITVVDKSLSVDNFSLEEDLQLFPNPTIQDWLTISTKKNMLEKIIIFDTNGRVVLQKEVNTNSLKLDLQYFSSGFYFVKVQTPKQQIVKRILKN